MLKVQAKPSCSAARRATADLDDGLHRDVFLARGARVMLTCNLWSEVGLVNGIRGDVVDTMYAQGEKAPAVPEFAALRLEGYTPGRWSPVTRGVKGACPSHHVRDCGVLRGMTSVKVKVVNDP